MITNIKLHVENENDDVERPPPHIINKIKTRTNGGSRRLASQASGFRTTTRRHYHECTTCWHQKAETMDVRPSFFFFINLITFFYRFWHQNERGARNRSFHCYIRSYTVWYRFRTDLVVVIFCTTQKATRRSHPKGLSGSSSITHYY